jgi:hypothetical protein
MTALGGMFYELCAELNELNWAIALQELFEIIEDAAKKTNKKSPNWLQVNSANGLMVYRNISEFICLNGAAKHVRENARLNNSLLAQTISPRH